MKILNDLNNLSGLEFERLCQRLLQKLSFTVETTKISGDGGIDLIAYSNKAFIKGKYIIQCKRYTGSVGEPIVRDLYGVVMSERANKGILISTGCFTNSAIKFAENKNLELIDGEELQTLLYSNKLLALHENITPSSFLSDENFDTDKYNFYKTMISQNSCTKEMGKAFIFDFLFSYFINIYDNPTPQLEIIYNGLSSEYIQLFDWYTNKYYKKGKVETEILPYYIRKYKDVAHLYNFDIYEYVKDRYDILVCKNPVKIWTDGLFYTGLISKGVKIFEPDNIPQDSLTIILDNLNTQNITYLLSYEYYELLNLLAIFQYFEINSGIERITNLIYGKAPMFKEWFEKIPLFSFQLEKQYFLIHSPEIKIINKKNKNGKAQFDKIVANYLQEGKRINFQPYFEKYASENRQKINENILKIENLIRFLPEI